MDSIFQIWINPVLHVLSFSKSKFNVCPKKIEYNKGIKERYFLLRAAYNS